MQERAETVPLSVDEVLALDAGQRRRDERAGLGEILGLPQSYLPRGANSWNWNGQLADESFAPAGRYRFAFRAMRIFGDPSDPADFETQTSAEFTIRYV